MAYKRVKRKSLARRVNLPLILIVISALVLIGLVGSIYAYSRTQKNDASVAEQQTDSAYGESSQTPNPTKETLPTSSNDKSSDPKSSNPAPPAATSITLDITKAAQEGSNFVVQTSIKGTGTGTCKLTLAQGASTVARSADVLFQTSYSTCMGFAVPVGEIPSSGAWKLVVMLESNGQQVAKAEKDVNITK